MRNTLQTTFAVVAGVLLVASAAFGAVPGGPSAVGETAAQPLVESCMVGPVMIIAPNGVCDDPQTDDLQEADALETKTAIYDSASVQKQNNDVLLTSFGNYLDDTQSIALMEGKNAYIRALENGTSEPVARNRATEAVADYYATKQKNLVAAWNTSVTVWDSANDTAANTTGVNDGYEPDGNLRAHGFVAHEVYSLGDANGAWNQRDNGVETSAVSLVNGSQSDSLAFNMSFWEDGDPKVNVVVTPDRGAFDPAGGVYNYDGAKYTGTIVRAPTDNQEPVHMMTFSKWATRWDEVVTQNDEVQSQLDTFINNTYDSYQQGQINTSELVDPYLGAREYAPENGSNFQSWALRSLTAMGINPPENLSNIGRMNVTTDGVTYTGILMSDENPEGGFTVGSTYNASELGGHQFVALDSGRSEELTGEFTLSSATTADGQEIETNETVTYKNVTYETANTEEFQELQNELDNLTAQINARQQRLRNAGGGGGFLPGFGGIGLGGAGVPVVLLVAAGGAVLLLGRN